MGGGHDGDVFGVQLVASRDPGPEAADRLERFGTGPKVGQVTRNAKAGLDTPATIDYGQVTEVDCFFDPATLDAHQWGGRAWHCLEYKERAPAPLHAE